jgi:chemotaxis protein CheZ
MKNATPDKKDNVLLGEIEKMARYILSAKQEIAAIAPESEEDEHHINTASSELEEVIRHTEQATNTIMDEAEAIQKIADSLGQKESAAIQEQLRKHVANMMQACTFQDITGQRIRKVLKLLDYIESRIGNLVKLFGGALPEGYVIKPQFGNRPDEELMNGPQLTKDAHSQEDIDRIFSQS